jgi:microcystin degradation protein MlrC
MADQIVERRDDFAGHLVSVEAAMAMLDETSGPTCLLDTGDNVGGGSPGDGTILLHALAERGQGTSLVKLFDPSAARAAADAGIGAVITMHVGGKSDHLHGRPFVAEFRVIHLCEGRWFETEVRHGGATGGEMGPCAVVQTGGVTVLLTSRRVPPFSLAPLLACGIDPGRFDVLVAKGVHAPVAAYRSVCRRFIRVNTPGVTDADMARLPFKHRRRPMYPFEAVGIDAGGPRTEQG